MAVNQKIPQRQCIGCGGSYDKKALVRIVKTSDNQFVFDDTGRKNGRGAYICRKAECFEKAIKNKGLERSFKMQIPKEVYEQLKKEMEQIEA